MGGRGGRGSAEVVDPAALERLRAIGGATLLTEIVELFCDLVPERLAAMERAVVRSDPVEVRRAADALRSSADNVGASEVAALATDIAARSADAAGSDERLAGLIRDLRAECESARRRLLRVAGHVTSAWT